MGVESNSSFTTGGENETLNGGYNIPRDLEESNEAHTNDSRFADEDDVIPEPKEEREDDINVENDLNERPTTESVLTESNFFSSYSIY